MYKKLSITNKAIYVKTRIKEQIQPIQCCPQNYKGSPSYREVVKGRLISMLEKNNIITINTAPFISSNKSYTFNTFNMQKNKKNENENKNENKNEKTRSISSNQQSPNIDIIAEKNGFSMYKEYDYLVDRCEKGSDNIFSIYRPDEYAKSIFYDIESCVHDYPNKYSIVISYDKHTRHINDLFIAYYPMNDDL